MNGFVPYRTPVFMRSSNAINALLCFAFVGWNDHDPIGLGFLPQTFTLLLWFPWLLLKGTSFSVVLSNMPTVLWWRLLSLLGYLLRSLGRFCSTIVQPIPHLLSLYRQVRINFLALSS